MKCGPRRAKFGVAEDNERTYVLSIFIKLRVSNILIMRICVLIITSLLNLYTNYIQVVSSLKQIK